MSATGAWALFEHHGQRLALKRTYSRPPIAAGLTQIAIVLRPWGCALAAVVLRYLTKVGRWVV